MAQRAMSLFSLPIIARGFLAALCYLGIFTQPLCLAQENVLHIVGEGAAEGTDRAARKAAIEVAKHSIIQSMLSTLVVRLDLHLFDHIAQAPDPYISSYDILHEEHTETTTQVEIEARLLEKPLQQTIASIAMLNLPVRPSILLVIGEQMGLEPRPVVPGSGVGEFILKDGIAQHNLQVDGSDVLFPFYTPSQLSQVAGASLPTAQHFAIANTFDVVIIGQAHSTAALHQDTTNVLRSRVDLSLQVYRGVDGKMSEDLFSVAAVHSPTAEQGAREALRDAATKLIQDTTTAAIIAYLGSAPSPDLLMTIQNPINRGNVISLFPFFESIPDVTGVEELFFHPQLARIRLRYTGKVSDFVTALRDSNTFIDAWDIRSAAGRDVTIVPLESPNHPSSPR